MNNQKLGDNYKVQIQHKNINTMDNYLFLGKQTRNSTQKNDLKSFDYSMDSSYSLHSHFSTSQHIEEVKTEKSISFGGLQLFEQKIPQNQEAILQGRQVDQGYIQEQSQQGNFFKNKLNRDLLDPQIMNMLIEELIHQQNNLQTDKQIPKKTYTSCLHQVVDKNHLESPSRERKYKNNQENIQISQNKQEEERILQSQSNIQESVPEKINPQQIINQQDPSCEPIIRPVQIKENQSDTQNSQASQLPQSPNTKPKRHQLQVRRIPSTLCGSYDQLLLSINKNQTDLKKDNLALALKTKDKSNQNYQKYRKSKEHDKSNNSPKNSQQNSNGVQRNSNRNADDEQLLVILNVVEGYCQLKTEGSHVFQTKFVINKNTLCFQAFRALIISDITKIKLIEKKQNEVCIKITHEPKQNPKAEDFLITLLTQSSETYFQQSYELFSQIILRKLLLMKICINQLNQRHQVDSPTKQPHARQIKLPQALPSILQRKPSGLVQNSNESQVIYESNLYKKSTFFNSWQKKFFALTKSSLQSFTQPPHKGQKPKPSTQLHKTNEIWTRFQLIYGYLVIKMWHSKIEKMQIGIPLCDFTNPEGSNNWLFGLVKNIVVKKTNEKTTLS